ncbi:tetratricopeptide repeat protein [Piscibacillus halophilus]|uniref:tetratricopeptide repeat protein n=1 Tax=Piscibacillus halophilus TaxID=571933 RepID=UPI002409F941|nr:tetratricopeptide repeat protein [Piscibacillus halophilus]
MDYIREQIQTLDQYTYFDEQEFLREKVHDREFLQQLMTQVRRELMKTDEDDKRCFLYGTLGNLYRLNEEPEQAIEYLKKGLELADPNSTREVVIMIRLGEAYKYNQQHQKALDQFDLAILKCLEYEPAYLDFAYQHKGKCLMEMRLYSEAMEAFQGAHAVRKGKKDGELLQSTEHAIEFLKKLNE